jgi:uncharacterized protein YifE (UPF0438 family)
MKAAFESMEKNGELLWQPYVDGVGEIQQRIKDAYQDANYVNASLQEKLTTRLGQTLAYIAPDTVSSLLTFATGGMPVFFGSQSQDMYELARQYGVGQREAMGIAVSSSLIEGALEKVGFNSLLGKNKGAATSSLLNRIGTRILTSEAITEGLQNISAKSFERTFRDDLGWDEFAETTILSMIGGAMADISFGAVNTILEGVQKQQYKDMKAADTMTKVTTDLVYGIGAIGELDLQQTNLRTRTISSLVNPLASTKPFVGPTINPIMPVKSIETAQDMASVRTGDTAYFKQSEDIRIVPDAMGRHYNEYEAAKVRAMDYDVAKKHITENYVDLDTETQAAIRDVLDWDNKQTWTIDQVAKAMQLYSDPNLYNAIVIRDDVRGSVVAPMGVEYIANSAELLLLRDSMISEMITDLETRADNSVMRQFYNDIKVNKAYNQIVDGDTIQKIWDASRKTEQVLNENPWINEARQYDSFGEFADAMGQIITDKLIENATKIKKMINPQKILLEKYVAQSKGIERGSKAGWSEAKKLFTKMARSQKHNLVELQQTMYMYMTRNPIVDQHYTTAGKNVIIKKIINLSKKASEDSMRNSANQIIEMIDKKMVPARMRAIADKQLTSEQIRKAKLDWEGFTPDMDMWTALPKLIEASKRAAQAEQTVENMQRFEELVDRQNRLYKEGRVRMHEKVAEQKLLRSETYKKIEEEITRFGANRESMGKLGKMLEEAYANPSLLTELVGENFANETWFKTFKSQDQNGAGFALEVKELKDLHGVDKVWARFERHTLLGKTPKQAAKTRAKYGVEFTITDKEGMPRQIKLLKDEAMLFYLALQDQGSRYALLGEHGSDFRISHDSTEGSVYGTLTEEQARQFERFYEGDSDTQVMVSFFRDLINLGYEKAAVVYKQNTGLDLPSVPNYVPIDVFESLVSSLDQYMAGGQVGNVMMGLEQYIGSFKDRRPNVKKTVNMFSALAVAAKYTDMIKSYVSYAKPIKDMQYMMKGLGKTLDNKVGQHFTQAINNYINSLNPYIQYKGKTLDTVVQAYIISREVSRILWFRPTTMAKQFASILAAGGVVEGFGIGQITRGTKEAANLLLDKNKRAVIEHSFPTLFDIRLTGFDPSFDFLTGERGRTGGTLLGVVESHKTFTGGNAWQKYVAKPGGFIMRFLNDGNFNVVITTYLAWEAKKQGKDLSKMSLSELSAFAEQHYDNAAKIIAISQPQYGAANRVGALANKHSAIGSTFHLFKAASLANANGARRAWARYKNGDIDFKTAAFQINSSFVVPALWCATVSLVSKGAIYSLIKSAMTPKEERKILEEAEEMETMATQLLGVAKQITADTLGQFPLLGEMIWAVERTVSAFKGQKYFTPTLNNLALNNLNDTLIATFELASWIGEIASEETYEQSNRSREQYRGDLKWKNEKRIEKVIDSGLKLLDAMGGVNFSSINKKIKEIINEED